MSLEVLCMLHFDTLLKWLNDFPLLSGDQQRLSGDVIDCIQYFLDQ